MPNLLKKHYFASFLITIVATIFFYCFDLSLNQQVVVLLCFSGLIGVPHGLTDWLLLPRLGRKLGGHIGKYYQLIVGLALYLSFIGLFFLAWRLVPLIALLAFLTISVIHFGYEDIRSHMVLRRPLTQAFMRGFGFIVLISCAHSEVTHYFNLLIGRDFFLGIGLGNLEIILIIISCTLISLDTGKLLYVAETLLLMTMAALLPALLSFTLYFCLWHTPRHYLEVWRKREDYRDEIFLRPLICLLIGFSALFLTYMVIYPKQLLTLDQPVLIVDFFQILASLTFAHVALNLLIKKCA